MDNISSIIVELFSTDLLEKEQVALLLQDMCDREKIESFANVLFGTAILLCQTLNFETSHSREYSFLLRNRFWKNKNHPGDREMPN